MNELYESTQNRINELEKILEQGQAVVQEFNYRKDLQVIENDGNADTLQRLKQLLDSYNTPIDKSATVSRGY